MPSLPVLEFTRVLEFIDIYIFFCLSINLYIVFIKTIGLFYAKQF